MHEEFDGDEGEAGKPPSSGAGGVVAGQCFCGHGHAESENDAADEPDGEAREDLDGTGAGEAGAQIVEEK